MNSRYLRWQWWVCVIVLSPIIVISFCTSFVAKILEFIADKIDFINYIGTPKWIIRFIKWGNGK